MNFTKLVPNVYYQDIRDGLKFFVDCLRFEIAHEELMSDSQKNLSLFWHGFKRIVFKGFRPWL